MKIKSLLTVFSLALLAGCAAMDSGESDVGSNSDNMITGETCGGFAGELCPEGQTCVDDPSDECDPEQGGADCMGVCVVSEEEQEEEEEEVTTCGGVAGESCPDELVCVDDPSDDCDPEQGHADCGGICAIEN